MAKGRLVKSTLPVIHQQPAPKTADEVVCYPVGGEGDKVSLLRFTAQDEILISIQLSTLALQLLSQVLAITKNNMSSEHSATPEAPRLGEEVTLLCL